MQEILRRFIDHLQTKIELSEEEISFALSVLTIKSLKRGDFLLSEGEVSKEFYFNTSGFIRLYYSQNGEDRTAYFYPEGVFISAYESFVKQEPSRFYLQATEPSTVVVIGLQQASELLGFSEKFETVARMAMEEELISHQQMVAALLTQSPEERYFDLLDRSPEIFQRVPQVQIASYIGVKPESLSRIKKRNRLKP